jgi:hypothetical protein
VIFFLVGKMVKKNISIDYFSYPLLAVLWFHKMHNCAIVNNNSTFPVPIACATGIHYVHIAGRKMHNENKCRQTCREKMFTRKKTAEWKWKFRAVGQLHYMQLIFWYLDSSRIMHFISTDCVPSWNIYSHKYLSIHTRVLLYSEEFSPKKISAHTKNCQLNWIMNHICVYHKFTWWLQAFSLIVIGFCCNSIDSLIGASWRHSFF